MEWGIELALCYIEVAGLMLCLSIKWCMDKNSANCQAVDVSNSFKIVYTLYIYNRECGMAHR